MLCRAVLCSPACLHHKSCISLGQMKMAIVHVQEIASPVFGVQSALETAGKMWALPLLQPPSYLTHILHMMRVSHPCSFSPNSLCRS